MKTYDMSEFLELKDKDQFDKMINKYYGKMYIRSIYSTLLDDLKKINLYNLFEYAKLNLEDPQHIIHYKNYGYKPMNSYLLNGKFSYEQDYFSQIKNEIMEMQAFILKNHIKHNLVTYRFVGKNEYKILTKHKKLPKHIKNFYSTTCVPWICNENDYIHGKLIKILIPQNMHGLILSDLTEFKKECEILLPFGIELTFIRFEKIKIFKVPVFICSLPKKINLNEESTAHAISFINVK